MEETEKKEDKKEHLDSSDQKPERAERIKNWFKNPYNLALAGVLVFSLIVLLYYFFLTKNQPLWWDEGEYMAMAKHWAFGMPYDINPQRPPLFSFLAAVLYKIGFSDVPIKFVLEIIPAFLVVFFTYVLVKEMFDKRIALIAAFITSVSWILIFYSMRFMTDSLGLLFGILALLCFWKGWVKKQGGYYIWLIGLFVALSFLCRLTGILYGAFIVFFLIATLQFDAIKNKNMWLVLVVFLLAISPYLWWSHAYFGNALAFRSGYGGITSSNLGWNLAYFVYDYPELVFFITFLIGLISIIPMFLVLDKIVLKKEKSHHNSLFMLLIIIFTLAFFIYFLRAAENRWLIMMSIGIFALSAKGISSGYDFIRKNAGKSVAIILLILVLASGAYFQLKHADGIIKDKIDSYGPIKDAGIWMKQNSNPEDKIFSISLTQTAFYSERETVIYSEINSTDEFDAFIEKEKPKFVEISIFEPHPDWVNDWIAQNSNNTNVEPAKIYSMSTAQGNQPVVVIYEIKY